ncbi:MAG: hypothetical protein GQ527_07190 [Bacteroidales bacterium]|nr:hypothetical protein [Bacteroidales bacterium]
MLYRIKNILIYSILLMLLLASCNKNKSQEQVSITPIEPTSQLSIILLLGDGLGIAQLTAAWHEQQYLNLQRFPYSGLVLTQPADQFVGESASSNTAMMCGIKTNYGFLGLDIYSNPQESLYEYLRKQNYQTGIITSSFITDATMAALYSHRENRYDYEDIALDFYHQYPDFTVAGGQKHFDAREDQINLLDSLQDKGVDLFYSMNELQNINHLPSMGMMHESRPPYLLDGREDFLYEGSSKALALFHDQPFFLFIEGAQIDLGGHDESIEHQLSETLEFDRVAGMALDYAENKDHILVLVVSDHESGALTLLQGDGFQYIPNYAIDEHSGDMVAVFAYGPGAENFTGIMDNTAIYFKLKELIDYHLNK